MEYKISDSVLKQICFCIKVSDSVSDFVLSIFWMTPHTDPGGALDDNHDENSPEHP